MGTIGVFDSGIGGLTVARRIAATHPLADLVYLGDTARLPYGAKSPTTVTRYAVRCVQFLVETGIDTLVVACNTASACALPTLRETFPGLEIHGVVEPGARAAVAAASTGAIGVIGTEGTIRSQSYVTAIHALRPDAVIRTAACPLLVPLAEVGWLDHEVTRLTLETYLRPLMNAGPLDALVLGCTHYPVLKDAVRAVVGPDTALVDSAEVVARDLGEREGTGSRRFFVTDLPERFDRTADVFWPGGVRDVAHVDITG